MTSNDERAVRTAIVTGGGTGIGRAAVRALAADGWNVVIVGRRQDVLDKLAAESPNVVGHAADLSDPDDVESLRRWTVERFPVVDLLVLNAGGVDRTSVESLAELKAHWEATVAQNILSAVLVDHAFGPHLRQPGGRVIVITSAAAKGGGQPAYGSAKAALNRWVVSRASQLGGLGITVNAIAPGFVPDTEFYGAGVAPDAAAAIERGIAVERAGTPEEIADAIVWLAGAGSGFVNGTVVEVDGGRKVMGTTRL
jgi:3-oxoacyl-[acyl-carrier protein] reductase